MYTFARGDSPFTKTALFFFNIFQRKFNVFSTAFVSIFMVPVGKSQVNK